MLNKFFVSWMLQSVFSFRKFFTTLDVHKLIVLQVEADNWHDFFYTSLVLRQYFEIVLEGGAFSARGCI